jgi:hypothetical protein
VEITMSSVVAAARPMRVQGQPPAVPFGAGYSPHATWVRRLGRNVVLTKHRMAFIKGTGVSVDLNHPPREVLC